LHPKINESFPKFILYHCVLHLDVLSGKVLHFKHVLEMMAKTVNTIRAAPMWQAIQQPSFFFLSMSE